MLVCSQMAIRAEGEDPPPEEPAPLGRMGYAGTGKRRLSYDSYLHLGELLALQQRLTRTHDELLFIVIHQVYELWFKVLLHELGAARDRIQADALVQARHHLRRVRVIERLLVEQIDVLETMAPQEFLAFRSELAPASGFQSAQFREIEFLSGLKDPSYLSQVEVQHEERRRLERRLVEPTLWDAFCGAQSRRGAPPLAEIYRRRNDHPDLFDLAEALLDHDEAFSLWRSRHIQMVERQIGHKPGTGGSAGVDYLRSTLGKRFFPPLWEVRSHL